MRAQRSLTVLAVTVAAAAALLLPTAASAAGTYSTTWGDHGGIEGISVNDAFTEAGFQHLRYRYDDCGRSDDEESCTWEIELTLSSPASRCAASTPEKQVVWDSGPQSGNGQIDSGPVSFALEGCPGQSFGGGFEVRRTFDTSKQSGPLKISAAGEAWSILALTFGPHWLEEAEGVVPAPAAEPQPMPTRPRMAVAADCRSLTIGPANYLFRFHQLGCPKATDLALMAYLSGHAPGGYRCIARDSGGKRCWRKQHPKKFIEWRPPRPLHRRLG